MAIPKVIHYCWFGGKRIPLRQRRWMRSWKRLNPDYRIVEWNEGNVDVASCPRYVREAFQQRKWAYVSDYVRLKVVYEHGGIYLDTDVKLLKKPDPLLQYPAYFGLERQNSVNTGLGFGAEKGFEMLKELMADYDGLPFILPDGTLNTVPCPELNAKVFLRHGLGPEDSRQVLDNGAVILPSACLCPITDYYTLEMHKTPETISIHYFSASWYSGKEKWKRLNVCARVRIKKAFFAVTGKRGEALWNRVKARR